MLSVLRCTDAKQQTLILGGSRTDAISLLPRKIIKGGTAIKMGKSEASMYAYFKQNEKKQNVSVLLADYAGFTVNMAEQLITDFKAAEQAFRDSLACNHK